MTTSTVAEMYAWVRVYLDSRLCGLHFASSTVRDSSEMVFIPGILLIILRVGSVQVDGEIMTVVSVNGTDSDECLNGGVSGPCKTLSFVLDHNSDLNCANSCDILLLNDQSLNSQVSTVKGHILISSPNDGVTLTVSHWNISGSSPAMDSLLLTNATLIVGGPINIGMFDIVQFIDIKFGCLLQWSSLAVFSDITTLRFDGLIVQSFSCTVPSGNAYFSWLVVQNVSSVKFFDCIFQGGFFKYPTYFLSLRNFTVAVFDSCTFRKNSFDHTGMIRLSIDKADSTVEIQNCSFIGNTMNSSIDNNDLRSVPLVDISVCKGSLTIERTSFVDNYATQTYRGKLIELKEMCRHSILNHIIFFNNTFILMEVVIPSYRSQYIFDIYNLTLTNNTASKNLISFQPLDDNHDFSHTSVSVTFENLSAKDNHVRITYQHPDMNCVIIFLKLKNASYNLTFIDSQFIHNAATPIGIQGAVLNLYSEIVLESNSAFKGGGLYAYGDFSLNFAEDSNVSFINNRALYGGAIYIRDGCPIIMNTAFRNSSLVFYGNYARNFGGDNVYLHQDYCNCTLDTRLIHHHTDDGSPYIVSNPTQIKLVTNDGSDFLKFYPGERMLITLNVTNCEFANSLCLADVYLVCNWEEVLCDPLQVNISGHPYILINSGRIDTGLEIMSNNQSSSGVKLVVSCTLSGLITMASFPIQINKCPHGMIFKQSKKQCECVHQKSSAFICRRDLGKACIEKGYWIGYYGSNLDIAVIQCPVSFYCNNGGSKCPEYLHTDIDTSEYVELNLFNENGFDDQCENGHGGTLCMYCAENKTFTYLAVQCMPNDKCKPWHPWVLLLATVILNFVIGSAIIVMVRAKFSIGSGYLYGPFFYLAVISQLLSSGQISVAVSLFTSLYLLEFEIIGYAHLCFFSNMNPLYSTGLHFVTPLLFSLILILTVVLARFCSNTCLKLHPHPVKSMSVLLLISFWSLVKTSIGILRNVGFVNDDGEKTIVPLFHPDIHYFTHGHIPLVIISVCVLVVVAVYMLLMMLAQCFSFYRLKPFLDEFQSCYQNKYRWYSVVYTCSMMCMAPLTFSDYPYVTHAIILAVTLAQCILQPYRKKWLNIVDTALLIDLTFITFLQDYRNTTLTWILVMIPLTYITLGTVLLLLLGTNVAFKKIPCVNALINWVKSKKVRMMKWCQSDIQSSLKHPQYSTLPPSNIFIDDGEREPLIGIIQAN